MVSTTRGQSSARRRTLRSWQHWKPFVSPPVTSRKHTPEKSRKAHQLRQKNKSVRTGLVNRLPLEILEEIIIQIDARTILRHSAEAWLPVKAKVEGHSNQPIHKNHEQIFL
ncbi:uncharacterized protein N7458_004652 [Penicillium daleae]|uniref:F-box domain-containing protein n=1 Tax=Penicillium daleae TaxID=63821 RepID=A0AAD6C7F7_9EURO|nr:uncharacterized protein N7458_004652 [Penicillium daleae]KAJ5453696.1 hypothetical protein N7458_004652 [Penicillium daleae]